MSIGDHGKFGFRVSAWSTDSAKGLEDIGPGGETLESAVERAWTAAKDRQYRSVLVMADDIVWIQFNMLWALEVG